MSGILCHFDEWHSAQSHSADFLSDEGHSVECNSLNVILPIVIPPSIVLLNAIC
jgi:hypothetical protein